jgi:hypothetical protein
MAPPTASTGPARPIGITTATVTGTVTPNAGAGTVLQFQYGTTKKYGSKTKAQQIGGVTPTPVLAKLTHLKARVVYHYRLVITTPDGQAMGRDRTFRSAPAPAISKLSIKPRAFRAGGKAATISYTETLPARVTFEVLQRRGRKFVVVGSFRRTDRVGLNVVRFNGRVRGRKLARGSYNLKATPNANRQNGRAVTLTFTITA